jgi:hypothetical protein
VSGSEAAGVDEAVLSAALSLGTFDLATLAAVMSRSEAEIGAILRDNPTAFERVDGASEDWRVIDAPTLAAPRPSWTPDRETAEALLN